MTDTKKETMTPGELNRERTVKADLIKALQVIADDYEVALDSLESLEVLGTFDRSPLTAARAALAKAGVA